MHLPSAAEDSHQLVNLNTNGPEEPSGSQVPGTSSPIRDGAGKIGGVSKGGHDITERIAAAEKIRQLNATLEQRVLERTSQLAAANAVKFTSHRTAARIETGCAADDTNETVIFGRDNGAGFDPRHAARRIMHRHNGRVWAEGVVDGGATFYFSIPKANGTPHAI